MGESGADIGQRNRTARSWRVAHRLFVVASFTGAALVFVVEPMIARLVLPLLGGSPAVWNTSIAFFQAALLAGYGYAHLLQRISRVRVQVLLHAAVLIAAGLVLPLHVSGLLGEPGGLPPAIWLTGVLALSVGPPFAALSATAPLLQAWYARVRTGPLGGESPYVLYVASNLGSLIALLAYPVLVEPLLRLRVQTLAWSLGYAAFILVMAVAGRRVWAAAASTPDPAGARAATAKRSSWRDRLTWVGLAAIPSSLMLGVTSYVATDIASAPFLWVGPLALYLLSLIIAFQARPAIPPRIALIAQVVTLPLCFLAWGLPTGIEGPPILLLHLAVFFLCALVCHQALVARRPPPERLTEFYLLMSVGGAVGGAFNAFVAPMIFHTVVEYPLMLALACLARPWGRGAPSSAQIGLLLVGLADVAAAVLLKGHVDIGVSIVMLAAVAAIIPVFLRSRAWMVIALCVVLALTAQAMTARPNLILVNRSFFGVLRVNRILEPGIGYTRELAHGTTLHGAQAEDGATRCHPIAYYAPGTPIGQVFAAEQAAKPAIRVGVIGMGAGAVAAFTRPGDSMRFFEIDPLDVRVATDPRQFSYINGCARGRIDWVVGDARLMLAKEPKDGFDLLLVDAFSSGTVPAHLLTVEAMRGYLAAIKPDGVVIMHLSNRNLDLMSPVAGVAAAAGGYALEQTHVSQARNPLSDASERAIIVARGPEALAAFERDPRWTPARSHGVRLWTDDYTNVFGALVRRLTSAP